MTRYTDGSKERVKDALDLVEIVSTRTDLRRVGGRFVGLCPFHEERTPSFSVSPEKGVYYCFGCQATGDGIRFVQETEALGFGEALEALAGRYNVELEPEHQDPREEERRRRRSRLESLLERTSGYYERFLWAGEEAALAREYLASRGLEEPVLRAFRVGYAPSAFDRVARGALRDGFTLEELEAAVVARRGRTGTLVDRFRERITFPLADARGRVLGFGARALRDGQAPKYLNTSENELYHKGRQLFGLDLARAPAARAGRVIVVEGYTDVLALHQAGIEEAVAVMGTAITPEQLAELSRAARTVFLALDADRAGQDAMLRAAAAAADRDVTLRVVGLPEGGDPADLVRTEGSERFRGRLDGAVSVVEFQVARVLATADLGSLGGRDRALDALAPLLAAAPRGSITREELIRRAADRLDVPLELIVGRLRGGGPPGRAAPRPPGERAVPGGGPPPPGAGGPRRAPRRRALEPAERAEALFVAMCLAEKRRGRAYLARIEPGHLSSEALGRAVVHLLAHEDDPLAGLGDADAELGAVVAEVLALSESEPSSDQALRISFLQLELRRVERELRRASGGRSFERERELWPVREGVRKEIAALMRASG